MALPDDTNDKIESYLNGTMDTAEKVAFEATLELDPQLREEVEFRKKTLRALELLKFKQEFQKTRELVPQQKSIDIEPPKTIVVRPFGSRYAIAASITLLLVAGFLYKSDVFTSRSQRAFNTYYQAETYARGGCPQDLPFFKQYADGKYKEALEQAKSTSGDSIFCVTYFQGLCYLAQDESTVAIPLFTKATESENNEIKNKAQWYLAMAYLEANEAKKAEELLRQIANNSDNPYSTPAGQIISDFFAK